MFFSFKNIACIFQIVEHLVPENEELKAKMWKLEESLEAVKWLYHWFQFFQFQFIKE